jgi:hypothetical protein
MISQNAFNIITEVDPARIESLMVLLDSMKQDPERNSLLPFGRLSKVHFGRFVLIPVAMGSAGSIYRPLLVLALNIDGTVQEQLDELVQVAATGLAEIYSHCSEFPDTGTASELHCFLRAHLAPADAFYINTIGRSLAQVQLEAKLHEALQAYLDGRDWAHLSSGDVHARLVSYVASEPDLKAALTPVERPNQLLGWLKLAMFALGGLVLALLLLPLLLPLLLLGLVVLRLHEIGNRADHYRPPNARINELEQHEDIGVQNPFSAVGYVQAGLFRRLLLRAGLFVLQLVARHLYNHGKLVDVDSIHFARWVGINDWRRLYFFSNFDGSAESYQDDFIERIAFGLNLVFSNGWGWPRNRYLLFDGASNEQAFKAYYRDHQIDTSVWYRAPVYEGFTAVNLANNAAIRAGLGMDMNDVQARAWLKRL